MSEVFLPTGWVTAPLGEYLYLKNGFAFKSNSYVEKSEQTVPVIRISDIYGKLALDNRASHVSVENSAEGFEIKNGDLLIAMSGATTGKIGVYSGVEPAYQNQRVGNLKLHSDHFGSASFRNHLLSSLSADILKISYGGAQPNISGKAIEEITIAFPPLAEQQQIAAKLDELLAQVDILKTRLDTIPKILKRFRQSVLASAVSGKLTSDWRETSAFSSKFTWDSKTIVDVCLVITDGEHITPPITSEGIPLLSAKDIRDGYIDFSNSKYVSEAFAEQSWKRCNPLHGDCLIVSRGATVGRISPVNVATQFCLMGSVILLRPNLNLITSGFLRFFVTIQRKNKK